MPSSIQEAFAKALSKTQAHVAQPIPPEWDDENPDATITEVHTQETTMKHDALHNTGRTHFQTTNNVTRATFEYVRDNPGLTRRQVIEALAARGYKESSTGSLVAQMCKQELMRETNGCLFAIRPEYVPLKSGTARKELLKTKRKPERKVKPESVEVAPKVKRVSSPNTLPPDEFDAQKFVDVMTLRQAKEVYDCLRKVFG